jgi:acetyl-CoA carboxylase biotin carboxyl carrier protein
VPEPLPPDLREPARAAADRSADHAAIDRLAEELLPALIAKLGATGLGELEVREGAWGVRLRRPADGAAPRDRRPSGVGRSQPGHAGHGHGPVPVEGHRPARPGSTSSNGSSPVLTPVGPGRDRHGSDGRDPDERRSVATSPAVGVYRGRPEVRAGNRVRAGDRLGVVDMLGIPQEVVAPVDGIVGASLVDSGDAVEYGQELVVIEFVAPA